MRATTSDLGRSLARAGTRAALVAAFALVLISSLTSTSWAKAQYKSLHRFSHGDTPVAGLVADLQGNLYGTTMGDSGFSSYGTVFELGRNVHGSWEETVLHSFNYSDGTEPRASVMFDAAGNLYGTTLGGGTYGYGTVFELAPNGHGGWKETVLHSFNEADGAYPQASVIFDAVGNLYGTTQQGGANGDGIVFELAPDGHGGWKETVLHSFNGMDGQYSFARLIFDTVGNLYGTTQQGGANGDGIVFELAPDGHGGWKETVLHSFNGTDGFPEGGLIFDSAGSLYGTAPGGGMGVVFELVPDGHGGWKETVLHSFNGTDGAVPFTGLIFDSSGNLYGTTFEGGAYNIGTVFELAPDGHGGWNETVLHSFEDRPGELPAGDLIFDSFGHLYGTTVGDQDITFGSVFEITP